MSNNLIPGISVTESSGGLSVPQSNQVVIGIIGTSEKGTADTIVRISSVAEAESIFGSNDSYGADLIPMIKASFKEGASTIKAISIGTPDLDIVTAATEGALTADSLSGSKIITVADATIYNPGDIVYLGPDSSYAKAERAIVDNGAGTTVTLVEAIQFDHYISESLKIVNVKTSSSYTNSISEMERDLDKNIVICEDNSSATLALLKTMAIDSTFKHNTPCVFIGSAEAIDTEATTIAKAETLNSDRVILSYPLLVDFNGKTVTPGENAAITAGVIAGQGLPKLNLNGSVISGYQGVSKSILDENGLLVAGISPLEVRYGTLHFIKIVTTKTVQDGIPNQTWREASIRLNVDVIEKTIISNIQKIYLQKANTPAVRQSIKQKIISMLEIFTNQQIIVGDVKTGIPAYKEPIVLTDTEDSTKINVDIQISPAKPLNFIQLNFNISI